MPLEGKERSKVLEDVIAIRECVSEHIRIAREGHSHIAHHLCMSGLVLADGPRRGRAQVHPRDLALPEASPTESWPSTWRGSGT